MSELRELFFSSNFLQTSHMVVLIWFVLDCILEEIWEKAMANHARIEEQDGEEYGQSKQKSAFLAEIKMLMIFLRISHLLCDRVIKLKVNWEEWLVKLVLGSADELVECQ